MRMTVALAVACLTVGLAVAQESAASIKKFDLNIPRQSLDLALKALAQQTGLQIARMSDRVDGEALVGPVSGSLTPDEALRNLLGAQGLTYRVINERTIAIVKEGAERVPVSPPVKTTNVLDEQKKGFWERVRVAEGEASTGEAKEENSTTLQEIVVTAQKREERLIDVPMSIAVITNQDIERRSLIGMEDYLRSIPGVNQVDRGGQDNAIVIRGITTSPQGENIAGGATVATYFDETSITAAGGTGGGGIDLRPVDFERIEVLRGPQGTTYGSASLGGALRLIPMKPRLDGFSAKVAASYSDTSRLGSGDSMIQGVLNIPVLEDRIGMRAVAYRYDESGFYRNIGGIDPATVAFAESYGLGDFVRGHVQDNVGQMRTVGGRLAVLWKATEKLDLSANFLTQSVEQDGFPFASVGKYQQASIPVAPQGRVRGESGEVADNEMDLVNLVLNYDFAWAKLTSAVSWIDSGSVYITGRGLLLPSLGPSSGSARSDFRSVTAETRLASQLEGRFQFLGGLFYENVDEKYLQHSGDWPGAPEANPWGTDPMYLGSVPRQFKQRAIFGEVSYDLTDRLTATIGGRFYKYDKDESGFQEGGLIGVPIGGGVVTHLESTESNSSFKANLSYRPLDGSLLYASWAEGFRLGRPTIGVNATLCDPDGDGLVDGTNISIASTKGINSDFLENYEIGGKTALFNRHLVLDAAVYHIKWKGLPINTFVDCGGTPNYYIANVGAATSNGAEIQASVSVVEGLRLDLGVGYTKAELAEDAPGLFPPSFKGDRLPGSPEVSANLSAQYDFEVAGHKAFVRADSFYTGEFYGDLLQTPGVRAGDYIKVDARAGVAIKNLSVELFVRNLTNEDAFTWRGVGGRTSGAVTPDFGYRLRPRTIGVQLGYSF